MKYSRIDIGLLIIRVVIGGCMLAFHGIGKLLGGVDTWTAVGSAMQNIGINFMPTVFGFTAGLVETLGSLFLILGLWTKPTAVLLGITMFVAALNHINAGDSLSVASHAIEFLGIFVAFAIMGPGKISVDKK